MNQNLARPEHPVIREIVRRQKNVIEGKPLAKEQSRLGLVVEGGAMRGIFSAGTLVALEELGLSEVFDAVYGESAGAVNASYFLSRQGSFGIRIYLDHLTTLKFANPFRIGKMLDIGYVMDVVERVKPLNVDRVLGSRSDFYIAITNAVTGTSRIVDVKREGIPLSTLLYASMAIVPLFNQAVEIGGQPYVDGGIANPVPVRAAIEDGCTDILVLLTQPPDFVSLRFPWYKRVCMAPLLKKWPRRFVKVFYERQEWRYNSTREVAFGKRILNSEIRIAVICPGRDSPPVSRGTISKSRLLAAQEDAIRKTKDIFSDLLM